MSTVTVHLVNFHNSIAFYGEEDPSGLVKLLREDNQYKVIGTMAVTGEGTRAAEEVFDLSNNPARSEERAEMYGNHRSLSVGDIVNVDGTEFVCLPFGWHQL